MTKYLLDSGREYEAGSPEELVSMMHADSFEKEASDQLYMEAAAKRVTTVGKERAVRTGSAAEFVEDLVAAGLVREVSD